ncbi:bile acid:sodium symporter family protein [Solidesulfovibrio sp.]|uniref:bile acid:sodium symporter family protein n=1 Tax=Solidesulfovibrio sp. TaxID=2910990 RepID=UPI002638B7E2|nr:bile acid:sodium symporter family protein [Solidesulfovibrio sp.]
MFVRVALALERSYLALVAGCCGLALAWPGLFTWIAPWIAPALGVIMFGMGLSLTFADFSALAPKWRLVAAGTLLQFTVMPGLAFVLSRTLALPPEAALGVILVGACPGGTASNVITYLAGGNLALSVTLTLTTTIAAPVLTPALTALLGGSIVHVDGLAMIGSVFWIVVFPVVDGLILRRLLRRRLEPVLAVFPAVSMLVIALVIACVVGLNRDTVLAFPGLVIAAVVLHNLGGFALGYLGASLFSADRADRVAIAVEVGMQNSGLAVALAKLHFTPAAALPGALFSLVQNLTGVLWARFLARRRARQGSS